MIQSRGVVGVNLLSSSPASISGPISRRFSGLFCAASHSSIQSFFSFSLGGQFFPTEIADFCYFVDPGFSDRPIAGVSLFPIPPWIFTMASRVSSMRFAAAALSAKRAPGLVAPLRRSFASTASKAAQSVWIC